MKGSVKGLSFSWAYLKVNQCYNKGGVFFYDKMVKGDIRKTLKKTPCISLAHEGFQLFVTMNGVVVLRNEK